MLPDITIAGASLQTIYRKAHQSPASTARTVVLQLVNVLSKVRLLDEYLTHLPHCPKYTSYYQKHDVTNRRCSCGLDDIIKEMTHATKKAE